MTPKQAAAAKKATAAAKAAKAKADELATAAAEAALAAEEVEKEVVRQHELAAQLEKDDPTLWEKIKNWFN